MTEFVGNAYTEQGVTVIVKAFTKSDSLKYLDRDVLAQGFQPIQITVQNDTNRYLLISKDGIDLNLATDQDVANTVETSTVGRSTGYGVAAVFAWPFAIPAIVDGVKSHNANNSLISDYRQKTINQQVILPHTKFTGIVFCPMASYKEAFSIKLIDRDTREAIKFNVSCSR